MWKCHTDHYSRGSHDVLTYDDLCSTHFVYKELPSFIMANFKTDFHFSFPSEELAVFTTHLFLLLFVCCYHRGREAYGGRSLQEVSLCKLQL